MKNLVVNIPERLVALSVFNNLENKVPTSDLRVYIDDVNKFRLTAEDKTTVKWEDILAEEDVMGSDGNVIIKKGGVTSYKWDETGVDPKSFEIDEFTHKFLNEKLAAMTISAADSLALSYASLVEKLK